MHWVDPIKSNPPIMKIANFALNMVFPNVFVKNTVKLIKIITGYSIFLLRCNGNRILKFLIKLFRTQPLAVKRIKKAYLILRIYFHSHDFASSFAGNIVVDTFF